MKPVERTAHQKRISAAMSALWNGRWAKRRKPARKRPEDALQRDVCAWLDAVLVPSRAVYLAIPNGGLRSVREAARMKRGGVKKGAPDLLIVWHASTRAGVAFIELKSAKGRVTKEQTAMHNRLAAMGAPVMVARSIDEVSAFLQGLAVPMRI